MTPLCEDCRRPIGVMRLRAVPTATRCPDCAERHEFRETEAGRGPMAQARRRTQEAMAEMGELDGTELFADRQGVER